MTGVLCGVKGFMGCGKEIESAMELYRCVDCRYAFHYDCILSHFNAAHNPHPIREAQLVAAIKEKEAEIIRLKMEQGK